MLVYLGSKFGRPMKDTRTLPCQVRANHDCEYGRVLPPHITVRKPALFATITPVPVYSSVPEKTHFSLTPCFCMRQCVRGKKLGRVLTIHAYVPVYALYSSRPVRSYNLPFIFGRAREESGCECPFHATRNQLYSMIEYRFSTSEPNRLFPS